MTRNNLPWSEPIRLLFVIDKYTPFGGLQRVMRRFAEACADRGHHVEIVLGSWEGDRPIDPRITVTEVPIKAWTNPGKITRLHDAVCERQKHDSYEAVVGFKKMAGLDVYYGGDSCLAASLKERKPRFARRMPRYRAFLAHGRTRPETTLIRGHLRVSWNGRSS